MNVSAPLLVAALSSSRPCAGSGPILGHAPPGLISGAAMLRGGHIPKARLSSDDRVVMLFDGTCRSAGRWRLTACAWRRYRDRRLALCLHPVPIDAGFIGSPLPAVSLRAGRSRVDRQVDRPVDTTGRLRGVGSAGNAEAALASGPGSCRQSSVARSWRLRNGGRRGMISRSCHVA